MLSRSKGYIEYCVVSVCDTLAMLLISRAATATKQMVGAFKSLRTRHPQPLGLFKIIGRSGLVGP